MRILVVVSDLHRGGVQRGAECFAKGFTALGHDVAVLSVRDLGVRARHLERAGVEVLDGRLAASTSARKLSGIEIVHVHAHRLPDNVVRDLRKLLPSAAFVEQSIWSVDQPYSSLADVMIHQSKWMAWKYICRSGHADYRDKLNVLPKPIGDTFLHHSSDGSSSRRRYDIPADAVVVGRVGQANEGKWDRLIVDAYSQLVRQRTDVWLLLVGAPPSVVQAVSALPEGQRVVNIAAMDDDRQLADVYAAISLFAHAAAYGETFGQVLAESLVCGAPVVTLSTPYAGNAQAELIQDSGGGLVAATNHGFSRSLNQLIEDPTTRRALADRAGAYVASWDEISLAQRIVDMVTRFRTDSKAIPRRAAIKQFQPIIEAISEEIVDSAHVRAQRHFLRARPYFGTIPKLDALWQRSFANYCRRA